MRPDILIVDDSPTQLEHLRYCLEQGDYAVRSAEDGPRALEQIRRQTPSLIISDIVMPGMTGFELCRAVKENKNTRHIPFVLLTSLDDAEDVLAGLESRADYYVTKPLDEEYLLGLIPRILAAAETSPPEASTVTVDVPFASGMRSVVTAPRQMLTLLVSSYEAAVRNSKALLKAEKDLQHLNENLETQVKKRTTDL